MLKAILFRDKSFNLIAQQQTAMMDYFYYENEGTYNVALRFKKEQYAKDVQKQA